MTSYCYKCRSFNTKDCSCNIGQNKAFIGGIRGCYLGNPAFRSEADCMAEAYFEGEFNENEAHIQNIL